MSELRTDIRNPVRVTNPKLNGVVRVLPASAVKHWRRLGWVPVDEAAEKGAAAAGKGSGKKEQ